MAKQRRKLPQARRRPTGEEQLAACQAALREQEKLSPRSRNTGDCTRLYGDLKNHMGRAKAAAWLRATTPGVAVLLDVTGDLSTHLPRRQSLPQRPTSRARR